MRVKLLFVFLLLTSVMQAQPTAEQMRFYIAKSVSDLKVMPEKVAIVKNEFVLNGKDSIHIRIYQPNASDKLPVIYFVHGGGYVAGDLNTHDNICRHLANALQAIVVAVDYRRPPENKFPAPFDDSYVVFKWINTHQKELNSNGKLILIGDSAGGQLVASICQVNTADVVPIPVSAQVLVNPALDLTKGSDSYKQYSLFVDWYLNETDNPEDNRISPLRAKNISKVPPAVIVVGEIDEIRKDGESYNKKLIENGIVSDLFIQPNTGHLGEEWCAASEKAKPAIDFIVKKIKELYLK